MNKKKQSLIVILSIMFITIIGVISLVLKPSSKIKDTQDWEQITVSAVKSLKVGKAAEANQFCNQAMKLLSQVEKEDIRMVKTYMLMGEIQRWEKKYDLAEKSFINAVNSCRKIYGPNHPNMVIPLESLANFYYYTKIHYYKVANLYLQILNIEERKTPPSNREVAIRASNLAFVYQLSNQYEKAEPFHKKALMLAENAKDAGKSDLIQYLMASSEFYRAWGKCEQADLLAKRALEMRESIAKSTPGSDAQLDVSICLDALGKINLSCEHPEVAEHFYMRSKTIIEKIMGMEHPDLVPRLTGLAAALRAQKKYNAARLQYERSVEVIEKGLGSDFPEIVPVLEEYAALLNEIKKPEEAKMMMVRADSIRNKNSDI